MPAFHAPYANPMTLVDITNLRSQTAGEGPRSPMLKKASRYPQTAHQAAEEQRARRAARNGAPEEIPNRIRLCSRCHGEGHSILCCRTASWSLRWRNAIIYLPDLKEDIAHVSHIGITRFFEYNWIKINGYIYLNLFLTLPRSPVLPLLVVPPCVGA